MNETSANASGRNGDEGAARRRADTFALDGRGLSKSFARKNEPPTQALLDISIQARSGELTALVGPDGAGKTTFLRLAAGLLRPDAGSLSVLDIDVIADPQTVQDRISYMPQRFGLYEDLSVQENLDLYADLHGIGAAERSKRYPQLMEMTGLGNFRARLAGKLSGGMKQKLGLACTLVRSPGLLLLDEPTVGVDPLSRRELWQIINRLVDDDGLSVVVSTSYMDEAEQCAHVLVLHEGSVLATGTPEEIRLHAEGRTHRATMKANEPPRTLQARLMQRAEVVDAVPEGGQVRFVTAADSTAAVDENQRATKGDTPAARLLNDLMREGIEVEPIPARLEDGFMSLLRQQVSHAPVAIQFSDTAGSIDRDEIVIEVHDLVRRFGDFTAVNRTSFSVHRGEVFGLLGPNGAGKTTTFRMLCGLLPASSGTLRVAGADLRNARAEARRRIGYVAQKFALYGQLNVMENLQFFAGAYGLRDQRLRQRLDAAIREFELESMQSVAAGQLPGGYKQRLAMAAAMLHEPEILFLDEPTSGADPIARREFWQRITALAEHGTTIIVTTHFMEEAEYCDRIMIQDAGTMLAIGTPAEVRKQAGAHVRSMEEAFIAIVEQGRDDNGAKAHVA